MTSKQPKKPSQPKAAPAGNVFDVSRPGRVPAAATSRPVILGHKAKVHDPMFTPHDNKQPLMGHSKQIAIDPPPENATEPALPAVTDDVPAATSGTTASQSEAAEQPASVSPIQTLDTPVVPAIAPESAAATPAAAEAPALPPEAPSVPAPAAETSLVLEPAAPAAPQPEAEAAPAVFSFDQLSQAPHSSAPAEPIKPLPKEAFEAIAADSHTPVDAEGAVIGGTIVSHHAHRSHAWLWVFLILIVIAVAAGAALYLGLI